MKINLKDFKMRTTLRPQNDHVGFKIFVLLAINKLNVSREDLCTGLLEFNSLAQSAKHQEFYQYLELSQFVSFVNF